MKINIITIFPDFFKTTTSFSILKRAQEKGLLEINIINLRDFAKDNYGTIDGHPYGGGAGMLLMIEPVYAALKSLQFPENVIVPSAKGKMWTQASASKSASVDEMTFIVPHFEGIDQRVIDKFVDHEICIGPYVLSGGELPTMTIIDSVVRLIPGVLGNSESIVDESFSEATSSGDAILEYPQYTKPSSFTTDDGEVLTVPDILLSGDHEKIQKWREEKKKILS